MLSTSQSSQYDELGFVLIPRLIDLDSVRCYHDAFLSYAEGNCELVPGMKLMKDVEIAKGAVVPQSNLHGINKLLNFEEDERLMAYVNHPELLDIVRQLIGPKVYSIVTNVFNKPPQVDGRHPLHQDLRYFRIRPPEGIVACWTAMTLTTRRNGCLSVIPRSHKAGLYQHGTPNWEYVNFKFYGIESRIDGERVHIEMEPGDTIFFHPLLVHGSGRNRSPEFRRSISAHFASNHCSSPPPDWRDNEFVRKIPD